MGADTGELCSPLGGLSHYGLLCFFASGMFGGLFVLAERGFAGFIISREKFRDFFVLAESSFAPSDCV